MYTKKRKPQKCYIQVTCQPQRKATVFNLIIRTDSPEQTLVKNRQTFPTYHDAMLKIIKLFNTALWVTFSGDDILKRFFLIFPRIQVLAFHLNCAS